MTKETIRDIQRHFSYDPITGVIIRIRTGKACGKPDSRGYLYTSFRNHNYTVHRLAWIIKTGSVPVEVDHINQSKSDNRWENLREASRSQNKSNCSNYKNNTSSVRGVSWHKATGKWCAEVRKDSIRHRKLFTDKAEAGVWADEKRAELFGEFAGRS